MLSAIIPKRSIETYIQECAGLRQFPSQLGALEQIQTNNEAERSPPRPVVKENIIQQGYKRKEKEYDFQGS